MLSQESAHDLARETAAALGLERFDVPHTLPARTGGIASVVAVEIDGPAAAAGFRVGDRVASIDAEDPIRVAANWQAGTRPRVPGVPMAFEIERNGERLTLALAWRDDGAGLTLGLEFEPLDLATIDQDQKPATIADRETTSAPDEAKSEISDPVPFAARLRSFLGKPEPHPNLAEYASSREVSYAADTPAYDPWAISL
jgi:hypothetical protein